MDLEVVDAVDGSRLTNCDDQPTNKLLYQSEYSCAERSLPSGGIPDDLGGSESSCVASMVFNN